MSEAKPDPGDWVARNAQPAPHDRGRPVAMDYARALSALQCIPGDDPDWRLLLAAWALEFDRAGAADARQWFRQCSGAAVAGVTFADAYRATPDARIAFVMVRAARYGWLDPLPVAVKSREVKAKQRAALEAKAARLAERERKARERNEAKAARNAAQAAKRATMRRETA
ncbi:conserved hypothetical protein [Paraburkholderia unamae]|uniref:hypothetical protein n=1 Tax=Paraburkholderia unamae TaxID=219649 RepID=UPI001CB24540|nr:hypothetical protein [Paraburkholderia unamae]CAG9257959.1 conserved hypothetical protein [Paraburkholderia unamae]